MRGVSERQATMMLGLTPVGFVPRNHPLRRTKPLADSVLRRMSPLVDELNADSGRPSNSPEHLLKASLLMAFFTVRSERQFCERLLDAGAARVLLMVVVKEAKRRRLLSADRFTVDGTLLDVWDLCALGVTPHVAQYQLGRRSAIDRATTRRPGYRRSQRRRKPVQEAFGCVKTGGAGGRLRYLGRARNRLGFPLTAAAFNLTRRANLEAGAA